MNCLITICKSLIESTHDEEVRLDAIRILATIYYETGQHALVEPTLEKLPEIYFAKLEQQALLLDGEKAMKAAVSQMGLRGVMTLVCRSAAQPPSCFL